MKINWTVRVLSVKFWLAVVPASLLVVQTVAAVFGYNWDFASLGKELTAVVNAVFALLTIVGVAVDPTTEGVGDSQQALAYPALITTKAAKIKALEDQIKALQGETDNSKQLYPHFAYADSADGKIGFSTTSSIGKSYMGAYFSHDDEDGNDPSKYEWAKLAGSSYGDPAGAEGPKGESATQAAPESVAPVASEEEK